MINETFIDALNIVVEYELHFSGKAVLNSLTLF